MNRFLLSIAFGAIIGWLLGKTVDNLWVAFILAVPISFTVMVIEKMILGEYGHKQFNLSLVKASERLPELLDPLPIDTQNERGVLFVCRTHSAAAFWYPSYGVTAEKWIENYNGWPIEQWEWIEEL